MTAPARITQADIDRAIKAISAAGVPHARIIMDLEARKIEIIIGDSPPPSPLSERWSDDDI